MTFWYTLALEAFDYEGSTFRANMNVENKDLI